MANSSAAIRGIKGRAPRTFGSWVSGMARLGYAAKGIVYTFIGLLALQAAIGAGGDAEGAEEAIQSIGNQPFGQVLLGVTGLGLLAYSLWRLFEAALDPEDQGTDAEGLLKRVAYAISGLVYLSLAYTAAAILFGWGAATGGEDQQKQEWTALVLAQPFGQWIVGFIGLCIIGVGLYQFYKAYTASFMEQYRTGKMSGRQRRWSYWAGRLGLAARGVTFCLIGSFLIQAAVEAQPSETRGLGGALETLAAQPYGPWLLGIVAAGLAAYGIHCFFYARFRRVEVK